MNMITKKEERQTDDKQSHLEPTWFPSHLDHCRQTSCDCERTGHLHQEVLGVLELVLENRFGNAPERGHF